MHPERSRMSRQRMLKIELLRRDAKAALARARQDGAGGEDDFHAVEHALALEIGPDRVAADAALQAAIDPQLDTRPYQVAQDDARPAAAPNPPQSLATTGRASSLEKECQSVVKPVVA